jgi:FkbM family methyltransferase
MAISRYLWPLVQACAGTPVRIAGARVRIPGPLPVRLSVVGGNIRLHRIMDVAIRRGATVVDVGANIGYNTVYASRRVGPAGQVIAVEPAADNVRILRENVARNAIENVVVHAVAAGRAHGRRDLFLRGATSAVNSLFQESVYAEVTGVEKVTVVPLDALVDGDADLVKIDIEGAELDALAGMTRLLANRAIQLIVEWHPRLQEAAGYAADELPRFLLDSGFTMWAASHTRVTPVRVSDVDAMSARLRRSGGPVELIARR